jgi:ankyrin repeat protein
MESRNELGKYYLTKIPQDELWRIFVDGIFWHQQNGWIGYENREPGSLQACFNGLSFIMSTLEQKIDLAYIQKIHEQVCKGVTGEIEFTKAQRRHNKPGDVRNHSAGFIVPINRVTLKGLQEFLHRVQPESEKIDLSTHEKICAFLGSVDDYIPPRKGLYSSLLQLKTSLPLSYEYYAPHNQAEDKVELISNDIQKLCDDYYKGLDEAKDQNSKLRVIAKYIQEFELLHPFPDANGRTFVNLLLNKMLVENNFPPAIFYEPNVFDLYSIDELVDVIKDAMLNTIHLVEQKNDIFNFPSSSIPEESKNRMQEITEDINKMNQELSETISEPTEEERNVLYNEIVKTTNMDIRIFQAISANDTAMVEKLANEEGINLDTPASDGAPPLYKNKTPLMVAATLKRHNMIDQLIERGANVNEENMQGLTVAHFMVMEDNSKTFEYLVKRHGLVFFNSNEGPEILEKTIENQPFITYALSKSNIEIAKSLVAFYPNDSVSQPKVWQRIYDLLFSATPERTQTIARFLFEAMPLEIHLNYLSTYNHSDNYLNNFIKNAVANRQWALVAFMLELIPAKKIDIDTMELLYKNMTHIGNAYIDLLNNKKNIQPESVEQQLPRINNVLNRQNVLGMVLSYEEKGWIKSSINTLFSHEFFSTPEIQNLEEYKKEISSKKITYRSVHNKL